MDDTPSPSEPSVYDEREQDWRQGAVVYQVLLDRFAPSATLEAKRALYAPPRVLRKWGETPRRGSYLEAERLWSHELEFWGGDLASLTARLDHIQQLGAEVLYLNPVHAALSNHKYDPLDHLAVAPEFGTRTELKQLADALHARGMKLVLDGVFNHIGRNAPQFRAAEAARAGGSGAAAADAVFRDWFSFGPQYAGGACCWADAENLPELNLDHPAVADYLYAGPDSVLRSFLRDGADGWRLDVAAELGPHHLGALTRAAHAEKPGSLVVGEIANYPRDWFPAVDGVLQFTLRQVLLRLAQGRLAPTLAQRMVERLVGEADYAHILRSWTYLENHDTARLASVLPNPAQRHLAQVLMFTLPGAPTLYYGGEVDMEGGDDPEMRAPMRWDRVAAGHPALAWTGRLVALRRQLRALRIGDFRAVTADHLLAFERFTDRARDSVVVLANPGPEAVRETVLVANSMLMDRGRMVDCLPSAEPPVGLCAGLLDITVPAHSVRVLTPDLGDARAYSPYKRVR